ncbi:MAG: hypothetical protein WBA35_10175 [Litorimonas sp.]
MATAVAGVAALIVALLILPMFPADAAGDIAPYKAPIYAFEFAGTPADLVAIFGDVGDPQRARRLDAMDVGNRWDFLFMAIYTAFGALFGWAADRSGLRYGSLVLLAAIVAGLADAVETRFLLSITESLREGQSPGPALSWLFIPVTAKFGGIAAVLLGAWGIMRGAAPGRVWTFASYAALLAGVATLLFGFGWAPGTLDVGTAIGAGWLVMIAFAVRQLIPPRRPRL